MNVPFSRIGHGGASALARANTLASFDVAAEIGVDMIEFDVRACEGELVLAHTMFHARGGRNVRLADALRHLLNPRFDDIEFGVDLKHPGIEAPVLDELRRAGLVGRALISSQVVRVLDRVRELEPTAHTGISVGGRMARTSRRWGDWWGDWRAHVLHGLEDGRWDALMAQHKLVDRGLLDDVVARNARLYAWTVNRRDTIDALRQLGVHGITTADPRLFTA